MPDVRLRRVTSKKEMENLVDDFITQGFQVIEQTDGAVLVRRKTWGTTGGHTFWALMMFLPSICTGVALRKAGGDTLWAYLIVWFTIGLGNLAYALVAHATAEQILLKLDDLS